MGSFTTMDAYLAGYLAIKGFDPTLLDQDHCRKIIFSFINTDQLKAELQKYSNGATVPAMKFALSVKNLKSQIFSKKMNNE